MTTMASSHRRGITWLDHVRLVWALARKDIIDGIRQKNTLTTVIISVLMVAFYRYLPAITEGTDGMEVWVYAENGRNSAIVRALERSPALDVRTADSPDIVANQISDTQVPALGLTVPATADTALAADAPVVLDGYTMRWLSDDQRADVQALIDDELTLSVGRPAQVQLDGNEIDLHADGDFFLFSASVSLVFLIVMLGISLVPNLMIEEKQSKTLDVLRVSPASASHIVAGKGIAGAVYGLVGCAVALFAFRHLIVQWPLAVAAALAGTLFMMAVGLLLGSVVDSRPQLQLIAWFVAVPMLLPVILVFLEGLVPDWAIDVMQYIPSVVVARVLRLSFTVDATPTDYVPLLAVTTALSLGVLALVAVFVRRQDRE